MQFWALIGPYLDIIWTLFGPYLDLIFDFILTLFWLYFALSWTLFGLNFGTSGTDLFPPKNAIVPKSRTQELNFSPKKHAIINCGTSILQKFNFSLKKMQLWKVRTSEIELPPKKMQLSPSPDFRNWTLPIFSPNKCNYQVWHVQTSEFELFANKWDWEELNFCAKVWQTKFCIGESPDFKHWGFPPKQSCIVLHIWWSTASPISQVMIHSRK